MGLPVAVEIAPPDGPREGVQALLAACSRAVATSDCVLAAEASETKILAVAIVTWRSEDRAVVEVGIREGGRPEWHARTVDFRETDEALERWRTVGFVVGTLARGAGLVGAEAESTPEARPAESPSPVSTRPTLSPARVTPRRSRTTARESAARAAVDFGAGLGPALDGYRAGAVLRTRWPLQDPLRALFALRYLERPSDAGGLSARWLTVSAGLGGVIGNAVAEIGVGLDARAERFQATAEKGEQNESDSRWLSGVGFGVSGALMPTPMIGIFAGGDAAYMFGETELLVANQVVATDKALRFVAEAGVRLRLW